MLGFMMDSFVELELFQDNAYWAGYPLYGKVNLFGRENINDVWKISLTLLGEEHVIDKGEKTTNTIIDQKFTVYDYSELHNVI